MMNDKTTTNVTSPRGSDFPQETTSLGRQGSKVRSIDDPKTTGIPAQTSEGTHVGVKRCAQTNNKTGQTRALTELSYKY